MNYFSYLRQKRSPERFAVGMDDEEFERQHPRSKEGANEHRGEFRVKTETIQRQDVLDPAAQKEDEGVRSYTTRAVKQGNKWVEKRLDDSGNSLRNDHDSFGTKGKHEKWLHLPPPDETKPTPTLDSFKNVPREESGTISGIPPSHLYLRKSARADGGDGKPQYNWEKDGVPLMEEECLRLEKALREGGYTGALFEGNTDVKVRPDLANDEGQVATWNTSKGAGGSVYGRTFHERSAYKMARRIKTLYGVYDEIKRRIAKGVAEDDPFAWLAYFMQRTKVRFGTSSDPKGGRGATDLARGDVSFSDDGETFYLAFNSKARQYWHSTVKDKKLYEYLKKRKQEITGSGANTKPLFEVSQGKFREYLKSISVDLTGDTDTYMRPHDFRHLGATRVVEEYLRPELAGMDVVKDRKKWEDRICKAVQKAAAHLNDTPRLAFNTYVLPMILFSSSQADLDKYFPHLKEH